MTLAGTTTLAAIVLLALRLGQQVPAGEFTPPDAAMRRAAVGRLDGLDPVLQRAFGDERGFNAIPKPGPGDWLAQHPEEGQTYDGWRGERIHLPKVPRNVIHLQPLGVFDAEGRKTLERLQAFMALYFCLEVKLDPVVDLAGVTERRNPHTRQRQYLSGCILERLKERLPKDAYCILAVTMEDLYPEDSWNFVFGQASLTERVGVFSLARYDDAFLGGQRAAGHELRFLRRALKVMAHETCHMFGILHDTYYGGLMCGSNHLRETDQQPIHLSPLDLRKLHQAIGFDVAARYRGLEAWYRLNGLSSEADWVLARLAVIAL